MEVVDVAEGRVWDDGLCGVCVSCILMIVKSSRISSHCCLHSNEFWEQTANSEESEVTSSAHNAQMGRINGVCVCVCVLCC